MKVIWEVRLVVKVKTKIMTRAVPVSADSANTGQCKEVVKVYELNLKWNILNL